MSDGFKQCRGPVQLGAKIATVTSLQTQHKALAGRAAGSRANSLRQGRSASDSPSGWRHPGRGEATSDGAGRHMHPSQRSALRSPPRMHQPHPPLRTGMTQRAQRTQARQHRADHGIPGAETPPGSHSPRGRGRGRGGFWLHLLCVPAAPPASVLKRSQSERRPKGRRGFGGPVERFCLSSLVGCQLQWVPSLPGSRGRQRRPRSCQAAGCRAGQHQHQATAAETQIGTSVRGASARQTFP